MAAFPTQPTDGQHHTTDGATYMWVTADNRWQQLTHKPSEAAPIGTVIQSILTQPQFDATTANTGEWVLADGRDVTGSGYATLTGNNNVPDLRGAFLRMAGTNSTNSAWVGGTLNTYHEDTTRRPRNTALTGTAESNGEHSHGYTRFGQRSTVSGGTYNVGSNGDVNNTTSSAGAHTHSVTINGGGDTETMPKCYTVN